MTPDEARILSERAAGAHHETVTHLRGNLGKAFGRPFVIVVALIYFFNQITNVGIVFNIPAIVEDLDISGSFVIGLLSGSAGIGATIGVLVVPACSRGISARPPRSASSRPQRLSRRCCSCCPPARSPASSSSRSR